MILLGGPDRILLMPFDASLGSLDAIWSFEAEALESSVHPATMYMVMAAEMMSRHRCHCGDTA